MDCEGRTKRLVLRTLGIADATQIQEPWVPDTTTRELSGIGRTIHLHSVDGVNETLYPCWRSCGKNKDHKVPVTKNCELSTKGMYSGAGACIRPIEVRPATVMGLISGSPFTPIP